MARKASKKADARRQAAESLTKEKFLGFVNEVADGRQDLDDAQMAHASIWKKADKLGIHPDAAKMALKLNRQESTKRNDFLRSFDRYREFLDLDREPDMFDQAVDDFDDANPEQAAQTAPATDDEGEGDLPAEVKGAPDGAAPTGPDAEWSGESEEAADEALEEGGFTFNVGRDCALEGKAKTENPHPKGSTSHNLWHRGWLKGARERKAAAKEGNGKVVPMKGGAEGNAPAVH